MKTHILQTKSGKLRCVLEYNTPVDFIYSHSGNAYPRDRGTYEHELNWRYEKRLNGKDELVDAVGYYFCMEGEFFHTMQEVLDFWTNAMRDPVVGVLSE